MRTRLKYGKPFSSSLFAAYSGSSLCMPPAFQFTITVKPLQGEKRVPKSILHQLLHSKERIHTRSVSALSISIFRFLIQCISYVESIAGTTTLSVERLCLTVNFVFLKHSELTVKNIINGTYTSNVFYLATGKVIVLSQNMGIFLA